jgi:predicted DNA-binding transcriptional regulator AlpA
LRSAGSSLGTRQSDGTGRLAPSPITGLDVAPGNTRLIQEPNRKAGVREKTGLSGRSIDDLERVGEFPRRFLIGSGRSVGWLDHVSSSDPRLFQSQQASIFLLQPQ